MKKICFLLTIVVALLGCRREPSGPPNPVAACGTMGSDLYLCSTGSPGTLLTNGRGAINVSVVGDNVVQFSQMSNYLPIAPLSANVTTQNGTGNNFTHRIDAISATESDLYFEVPASGSYTIRAFYIEYGNDAPDPATTGNSVTNCPNPQPNLCFRWFTMVALPDGARPSCDDGFAIVINQMDPNGFIGNCF